MENSTTSLIALGKTSGLNAAIKIQDSYRNIHVHLSKIKKLKTLKSLKRQEATTKIILNHLPLNKMKRTESKRSGK